MLEILNKIKFQYVLTILLVLIISGVVFMNIELTESAQIGLLALTTTLSGVTGFMFGITQARKEV